MSVSFLGGKKCNYDLLRFTSPIDAEFLRFTRSTALNAAEPESYHLEGGVLRFAMGADSKRNSFFTTKLETYCAAFPFTTIPINNGSPLAIVSLPAKTQCSWPSLLTAGAASEAGCTRFMGPG